MAFANRYTFEELARPQRASGGPLALPPTPVPLPPTLGRELAQILVSDVKKRFATGTTPDGVRWKPLKYPRPSGAGQPLKDTGRLMASIVGKADLTSATVGTNRVGASLQNFGGVVRPRKGKFLSIPLTRQAKRAGSPRRMKGTVRVPLFARKVGGKMVGHFLLVKKAVVPARTFLGVSREAWRAIESAIAADAARRWQQSR